jgi:ADP-ribosylglycohydrolase
MRVSPIGLAFDKSVDTLEEAKKSALCSHSHEEGIKGAMVTSLATWYLSHHHWKKAKEEVQNMCIELYGKDYVSNLPKIGEWNETCQGCVPLALHLFSLSHDFEDAIRIAISYGGDSDTIGAIVGGFAGAFYEIPLQIVSQALSYLPDEMIKVIRDFDERFGIDDLYMKL